MVPHPKTCAPNDHLEDVAAIMRKNKIGSLPVVKDDRIVGIITESDIFEALIKITGGTAGLSKRISLKVSPKEKTKQFYEIVNLCENFSMDVLTILTHFCKEDKTILITLRVSGEKLSEFVDALWGSHYQVLTVE